MPMAWHFLFGESDEHADRIQQIVKKEYNSWIDSIGTGGIINRKRHRKISDAVSV